MNDQIKAKSIQKENATIKENYEDSYWSKKYGVSEDEMKQSENNLGIRQKILRATFDNKSFA